MDSSESERAAPKANTPAPAPATPSAAGDEEITDDEFEALLDQLHGSGQGPTKQGAVSKAPEPPVDKAATEAVQKAKQAAPAAPKATPAPSAAAPAKASAPAGPKAAPKKDEKKAAPAAPPAETTVRVDTKRLDQIMNMVGELVLVRNRLISLGINSNDESMSKAIAMLNEVNAGKLVGIEDLGVSEDVISTEQNRGSDAPLEDLMQGAFQKALAHAITTLPEREAIVLSLYYDEELNLREIGEVLDVSESRVSQIHSQAMLKLKSRMKSWQADEE